MKLLPILFFLFIIFCPCVAAEDDNDSIILDFLDMLNNNTWDNDFSSLNYEATNPAVVWVSGPHMVSWVDIVGFRNMSRINNTDYIYGAPVDCVIVESEVKDLLTWNDNVDWIDKQYSYNVSNGNITVTLNISMLWHHSTEITHPNGNRGVDKDYYYSHMTLHDTETLPLQYNFTSANIPISIIFYNNTFSPKSVINVPVKGGLFFIVYSYKNESIKQNLMNAEIEKNQKGIEFINFTEKQGWGEPDGNISHVGGYAVVSGANFTLDNITIVSRTPYQFINMTDYNLTIDDVTAGSCFNPVIIPFMVVLGLLLSTLYIIIKRIGR